MNRKFTLSLVASVIVLVNCDGGGMMMIEKPDTDCGTPAAVTLAQLQTNIIEGKCKTCHFPDPDGAGTMMEGTGFAYGDYTDAGHTGVMRGKPSFFKGSAGTLKIVDIDMAKSTAERLANSTLWLKVSTTKPLGFRGPKGESSGNRMPNDGTPFTPAEMKQIKDWICTGAPD